jgi:uncharacterized protein YeaO (DUF488 family)
MVRVKRAYDPPDPSDGLRVLVDRLWPRGLSKEKAAVDEWLKEVAPSTELRRWYGHDPARFTEFAKRYRAELRDEPQASALARLREIARDHPTVTLLTATREAVPAHTAVLTELLDGKR